MIGKKFTHILFALPLFLLIPYLSKPSIQYSPRTINVYLNGHKIQIHTIEDTVNEALLANGIFVSNKNFDIYPQLDTSLTDNLNVLIQSNDHKFPKIVKKIEHKFITNNAMLNFKTVNIEDAWLARGRARVAQSGKIGKAINKYKITLVNGKVTDRKLTSTKTIIKPVNRILKIGTGSALFASRGSKASPASNRSSVKRQITVTATGYYKYVSGTGITATGRKATKGIVAVDPRFIPLGTKLYIPGYGYAIAADTGGAIKGSKIDLCFDTYREAIRYGRRKIKISILR